jgi:catechol 2,3-dioxygenase-like lactoylglutathione lyase family enzyme
VTAPVWYRVRDLDAAGRFYVEQLGFEETYREEDGSWSKLRHGAMEIALTVGEPLEDGGVAHVDVEDVKAEAERLRAAGVEVGVVLELSGEIRLVDVFDPDGNRIQLAQDVRSDGEG